MASCHFPFDEWFQHGKMKSHCYRKTVLTSTISQRVVLSSQLKECQFRRFAGQCFLHFADPCSIRSPSQPYSPSDRVAARRNLSLARHTGFPFLLKSTPPQTDTSRAIGPLSTVVNELSQNTGGITYQRYINVQRHLFDPIIPRNSIK